MTRGRDTWTYAGVCTRSAHARFGWGWSAVPYPSGVEYDFLEVSLPSQLNSGGLRRLCCIRWGSSSLGRMGKAVSWHRSPLLHGCRCRPLCSRTGAGTQRFSNACQNTSRLASKTARVRSQWLLGCLVTSSYRPLPDEIIAQLIKSRYHNKALSEVKYLSMALIDLQVHAGYASLQATVHSQPRLPACLPA